MSITKYYLIDGEHIECQIEYKKIKNAYIRLKNNILYVSANKYIKIEDIDRFVIEKYPLLKNKMDKKVHTEKYQLWGKVLSEDEFYLKNGLKISDKNYYLILKNEVRLKTEEIFEKISSNLQKLGLNKVPFIYKKLTAKYGSCHIVKKEITLNIFLAKIDPIYLEYVIYHEYAHLIVPNHSQKFYHVLDQLMANHKEIEKELKKIPIIF
ncbi:conserved hypothetical protein (DUF45) [Alteracholeplasma palmae J233]|uniref:YgjP-like metallopeptidase domain-containing protein n=1 Tax=Alteracholeplasma palmae (strain ATCC 49389 / J233) TaxID=1318466 RepID=U4KKJ9_ALTPJ|nr:M48 family metallopeptidase [Alteracholeplasma palmae]CCV64274.1 conserved hypothetical protein (DUF45) [Alteracholeplasma palmae J233]